MFAFGVVATVTLGALAPGSTGAPSSPEARAFLEAAVWRETPEALEERLAAAAPWNARCDEAGCSRCLTPPQLHQPACLALVRVDGGTRLELPEAWWVDDEVLRPVVQALEGIARSPWTPPPVEGPPRMGPVAGLHFVTEDYTPSLGFGARLGWRGWVSRRVAVAGLVEYDRLLAPALVSVASYSPAGGFVVDQVLALTARVELGEATPLGTTGLAAPKVAAGLFASATVLFSADRLVSVAEPLVSLPPAPGFRAGLCLTSGRPGAAWIPAFGEVGVEVVFEQGDVFVKARAAVGVGF